MKWMLLFLLLLPLQNVKVAAQTDKPQYEYFLDFFLSKEAKAHEQALEMIERKWQATDEILALESLYFLKNQTLSFKLLLILERKTGQHFKYDFNKWYEYIWNKPANYTEDYYAFKAILHSLVDPKFRQYFLDRKFETDIRLDEVRWGGVVQDGIPPLRNPEMITAKEASYLDDDDIVFGIAVNGDIRAYPKRILAWHEMFTDTIGETPVAGVYCTLCGTVILYKTEQNGVQYEMGTSGFLYRSNKLMYDQKTQSLWNTLWGKPVIGPLVGKNIQLEYLSVVTTTWGAWKKRHPTTKVLSLNTGHRRNYGEGIAYKDYFATDKLMFNVPKISKDLANKDEVLAIRLVEESEEVIAISSRFLRSKRLYKGQINGKNYTVFTDKSGAHRVFLSEEVDFVAYDKKSRATDSLENIWILTEEGLQKEKTQKTLERLPTYNAFWFGFKAAFPDSKLIK